MVKTVDLVILSMSHTKLTNIEFCYINSNFNYLTNKCLHYG